MKKPKIPAPTGVEKFDNFEDLKKSPDKLGPARPESLTELKELFKLMRENSPDKEKLNILKKSS